jgi:DNA invertase Pin-like site-specific DNA recombinase
VGRPCLRTSFGWQAKEQTENLSLPTQLRACEEYCRREGFEIRERFKEEGESAKSTDRSQLQNLLTYCRLNKGRVHFVVVFNLTRFARDTPSPEAYGVQASTTTSRSARTCNRSASLCGRQRSRSTTRPQAS